MPCDLCRRFSGQTSFPSRFPRPRVFRMDAQASPMVHHGHPTGWRRYLYSTNHKDIGTMYLMFSMVAGLIGGLLSIGMRLELEHPGMQIFATGHEFNVFV